MSNIDWSADDMVQDVEVDFDINKSGDREVLEGRFLE